MKRESAFSLVELLLVVAVIVILMALAVPAFTSIAASTALTRGGESVAEALMLASQEARTRNRNVEVRFIKSDGPSGEPVAYRMVQLWAPKSDRGQTEPLFRLAELPGGVVVSDADSLSPLLSSSPGRMAVRGQTRDYAAVVFRPNGEVFSLRPGDVLESATSTQSMITVVSERDGNARALPDNFFAIYVNPLTGAVRVFRP